MQTEEGWEDVSECDFTINRTNGSKKYKKHACFSPTWDNDFVSVDFFVAEKDCRFTEQQVLFIHNFANQIGLEATLKIEKTLYSFNVESCPNYTKVLGSLMIRRYLQEETNVFQFFFDNFWEEIQSSRKRLQTVLNYFVVSHYLAQISNSNHTFLASSGYYSTAVTSLVSLKTLQTRLKAETRINQLHGRMSKLFLGNKIKLSKQMEKAVENKDAKKLLAELEKKKEPIQKIKIDKVNDF